MKQFAIGLVCGVLGVASIAAAPQESDPCEGWKLDVLGYQAAILGLCENNYDLYQNVLNNMGFQMSILLEQGDKKYVWEHEKLPKSQQIAFDRLRDQIMKNIKETMNIIKELEQKDRIQPRLDQSA